VDGDFGIVRVRSLFVFKKEEEGRKEGVTGEVDFIGGTLTNPRGKEK
jgi:hypothetical protein